MKKGKLLAVALIGLILAGGLALASCRAGCPGVGDCEIKDGKGSYCSNGSDGGSGCAATEAASGSLIGSAFTGQALKTSGKCDC